ncbi:DnaT-like ssDNA-binding protein [Francisella marina]|uniref:DnaT-like ssDNA-binding protein n=1 Tax=Francisella marina TaxID=2249302 RepID=UPI0011F046FE|nr:DnaT-like ssDNA-binding protein [Francisella marina]QEO58321.1 hypothetical protein F0R75_00490 [Francisella marina]
MPTIIEQLDDGSISNANSYITVAEADTYFADRNNTTWSALTTDEKGYAIIKAFDYLENNYTFKGSRLSDTDQNTAFPREYLYIDGVEATGIPEQLKKAQYEFAVLASAQDLDNNYDYANTDGTLQAESIEIAGAIKESKTYDTDSFTITPYTKKYFQSAMKYLKSLTKNSGGGFGSIDIMRTY